MKTWVALLLSASVILALGLRLPNLQERPMHNDEAVNGVKIAKLVDTGTYIYDPDEHHGPSLYYISAGVFWFFGLKQSVGLTETQLRVVVLLFGVGLIFLLPLILDGIGARATAWAGIFIAASPAMVFYSRYYIH